MSELPLENESMQRADAAIRDCLAGRVSLDEMMGILLQSQVAVPLAELPQMQGNIVEKFLPATAGKQGSADQYVVAFTDGAAATEFAKNHPEYPYCYIVQTDWLVDAIGSVTGIVLNPGGLSQLAWDANGAAVERARRKARREEQGK